MKESIILAVDGGATKTTLTVRSSKGKKLFEQTAKGSNYQTVGEDVAIQVLSKLLSEAYRSINLKQIDVAAFAIAGLDTEIDLAIIRDIIKRSLEKTPFRAENIIVENDVHATLLGLVGNHPGALVISGTGSVAFATNGNGKVVRTGGWGHRASDEGSGYWIGQKIVNTLFRIEDGLLDGPTILKELVFEKLQIKSMEELMLWLYHPNYTNAQLASISSILPKAVSIGDEHAITIAQNAAYELFLLVSAILHKIYYQNEIMPLYVNGGVLKHHSMILKLFKQSILQAFPFVSIELCNEEPIEYIVKRATHCLKDNGI